MLTGTNGTPLLTVSGQTCWLCPRGCAQCSPVCISMLYETWLLRPCWSPTAPVGTHRLSWTFWRLASSLEKQGWEQVIKIPAGNTRVKGPNYTYAVDFLSPEKSFGCVHISQMQSEVVQTLTGIFRKCSLTAGVAVLGTVVYYFSDMQYIQHHSLFTGQGGS